MNDVRRWWERKSNKLTSWKKKLQQKTEKISNTIILKAALLKLRGLKPHIKCVYYAFGKTDPIISTKRIVVKLLDFKGKIPLDIQTKSLSHLRKENQDASDLLTVIFYPKTQWKCMFKILK